MDLIEISLVNVMDLGQFSFFRVLGTRSEIELTRLDFGKKDPSSTTGVVRLADGRPGSSQIYRVDWVCG